MSVSLTAKAIAVALIANSCVSILCTQARDSTVDEDEQRDLQLKTEAIRRSPRDAKLYYGRGLELQEMDSHADAIADFTAAINLSPANLDYYSARAQSYSASAQYAKALADLDFMIKHTADLPNRNHWAYNQKAIIYMAQKNYDAAINIYTMQLKKKRDAESLGNRSHCYEREKRYAEELKDLNETISLAPYETKWYRRRAETLEHLNRWKEAIPDYSKVIELDAENVGDYVHRADARVMCGDLKNALVDYTAAIKMEPGFATAYSGRAKVYAKLGDAAKANADMEKARKLELKTGNPK
jgi:tetratricopeptide (TPR) repeat protein